MSSSARPSDLGGSSASPAPAGPYRDGSNDNPSSGLRGDESDDDSAASSTRSNYDSDEDEDERDANVGNVGGGGGGGGGDDDDEDDEDLAGMAEDVGGLELDDDDDARGEEEERAGRKEKDAEAAAEAEAEAEAEEKAEADDDEYDAEFDNVPTLQTVARWILEGSCKRILVLSGAGVSCSAGIPDFRTPGTGLYDNLQKYDLPYPQAVFDLDFYRINSGPFVSLASEIWPGTRHSPTLTHSFVTLLDRRGLLLRNYTQNIDGLEVLAGVSEDRIVECHGHFRTASCVNCSTPYDGTKCRDEIVLKRRAPRCHRCRGPVKPDVVFFGEGLPDRFGRLLRRDLRDADLLIVMGTSLTVAPVSLIPEMVNDDCPRVLVNREFVGDFNLDGGRDVFAEGDCDDTVQMLCRMMKWDEELRELNEAARIVPVRTDTDDEER